MIFPMISAPTRQAPPGATGGATGGATRRHEAIGPQSSPTICPGALQAASLSGNMKPLIVDKC